MYAMKNYQFNIPSHLKLDMKQVADLVKEKCEFENPDVIKERFGLVVGSVPPFGNLMNIETYYDERISGYQRAAFNCGFTTESLVMATRDLLTLVEPKMANFAKE